MGWKKADKPPMGKKGCWTNEVVVVTNYGDVFSLSYFNGEDGGNWQRPARFNDGEEVEFWTEKPIA